LHRPWLLFASATFVAVALGAVVLAGAAPRNVDDGFIVLVYARHLAETGHIFWNIEDGPVDGFTSMLDMLVKASSALLAPEDLVRNAHVIAIVAHLGAIGTGAVLACRVFARPLRPWDAALALLAATSFALELALAQATSYLLESPLFTGLCLLATGLLVSERPRPRALVLVWSLLALARPEGMLLCAAQAIWFAVVVTRERPLYARIGPGAVLGALVGAYLLWHLVYFGALAPNTFYAKSSDSRWNEIVDGAAYVASYARSGVAAAVLAACVFLAPLGALAPRAWRTPAARSRFVGAALTSTFAGLVVVLEGGDSYEGGRFLAAPFALALFGLACAASGLRGRARFVPALPLALVVVTNLPQGTRHLGARLERIAAWPLRANAFGCGLELSRVLAARATTVAQTDFQQLKFHRDDLRVIDLMGLNDRGRAHSRKPGPTRWGKGGVASAPATGAEVLELGPIGSHSEPMARHSTARLVRTPSLATAFIGFPIPEEAHAGLVASYTPVSIPICGLYFNAFVRNDVAARFADVGLVRPPKP
jgi:hypothetical protein